MDVPLKIVEKSHEGTSDSQKGVWSSGDDKEARMTKFVRVG